MKKRFGTMALMAIMLLCTAMTCSGGDDSDNRNSNDSYLELRGTTWESTSWMAANQGYSDSDGKKTLTITFRDATYEAWLDTYKTGTPDNHTAETTLHYGGDYELSSTFMAGKYYIYCYDGNGDNESIRFEVFSQGSSQGFNRMEGYVYFPKLEETYRVVMVKK